MVGNDAVIYTHDIPLYFTEENLFFIGLWMRWKRFGNPWGCGWANWPWWSVIVFQIIENTNEVLNAGK